LKILILFQSDNGGTNVLLNRTRKYLIDSDFEVVSLDECESKPGTEIDLAILPTSEMRYITVLLSKKINIKHVLVWAMGSLAFQSALVNHMNISIAYKIITLPLRIFSNVLLASLLSDRAVIFTDEVGMHADIRYLKNKPSNLDDLIFPIAIDAIVDIRRRLFSGRPRRFMWIGRIDRDFKVLPLLKVIRDISSALSRGVLTGEIEFFIIGTGDGVDLIQKEIDINKSIVFKWQDKVNLEDLPTMIIENTDVLIAMGTSALEGARCGIPTVIVQPFSNAEQEPALPYRWLHQTVGHSLGEFPGIPCMPLQPKFDFDELWDVSTPDELSLHSLNFSQKYHSDNVFSRLFNRPLPKLLSPKSLILLHIHSAIVSLKDILKNLLLVLRWKR
jgi:hypothetical protein